MNKKEFLKLIANAECYSVELDRWSDFGIDLFELPISEISWAFFDIAIQSTFTERGVDIINWWLFEKNSPGGEKLEIKDDSGNVIPTNTMEDLWKLVKDYRK